MLDAERPPKIQKRDSEDRISSLPDDLLLQILSRLPTKRAVSTMFLSKRWRFVWTMLPKLFYRDTKYRNVESKTVWRFLNESMRHHKAPVLERLLIQLGPHCPVDVDVVNWVSKAVDRRLTHLYFKLLWNSERIRMPSSIYTCKTLTTLTLSHKILVDVPSSVCLPSLTNLALLSVVYKDEDSLVRLLSSCPVLELLHVKRRNDVDDNVRKFTVKVPSLKELIYVNKVIQNEEDEEEDEEDEEDDVEEDEEDDGEEDDVEEDEEDEEDDEEDDVEEDEEDEEDDEEDDDEEDESDKSLIIDTPALECLDIEGILLHSCSIEYMPHLVEASIDVAFYPNGNFKRSLSLINCMSLSLEDTMVPWSKVNYSQLRECSIELNDPMYESLVVLLSNCPKLQAFMVESLVEIDDEPLSWNQPSYVPECLLSHLEIFNWSGYLGREDEKGLIRYILENSRCLKPVSISPDSDCNLEQKLKMMEELNIQG